MKRLLFVAMATIFFSLSAISQGPPTGTYTPVSTTGYNWLRGYFRALHLPAGAGAPTFMPGQWTGAGAIYLDSIANIVYYRQGNVWRSIFGNIPTLQQVTTAGRKSTDTVSMRGVRTRVILPDTASELDYSMGVLPDPQYTTLWWPIVLQKQFKWFTDSAAYYNMKALVGVGDLTQNATVSEFQRIDSNYDQLDLINLPYITPPGNHDYDFSNPSLRGSVNFKTYFGDARHSGHSYYGYSFNETGMNSFIKLDVGAHKWLILALEFYPPDPVLVWAQHIYDSVTAAEPDRMFWITTHAYITSFGDYAVDSTSAGTGTYGITADNDGLEMWNKFIRKNKNIRIVTNGHFRRTGGNEGPSFQHFTDVGDNGNLVHQFCYDNQQDNLGGDGYFMRIKFSPSTGTATTYFYSNYLNTFDSRLPSFTFDFDGLDIQNSVSAKEMHVTGRSTFDSTMAIKSLAKGRLVYTMAQGKLMTKDNLAFNEFTNILNVPFLRGDSANFKGKISIDGFGGGQAQLGTDGIRNDGRSQLTLASRGDLPSDIYFMVRDPVGLITSDDRIRWGFSARAGAPGTSIFNLYQGPYNSGFGSGFFGAVQTWKPGGLVGINNTNPLHAFDITGDLHSTLGAYLSTQSGSAGVGIGTTSIGASAALQIDATTKGVLIPRMTTVNMLAIVSPANGLLIMNSDSANRLMQYDGTAWHGYAYTYELGSGVGGGSYTGSGAAGQVNVWSGASAMTGSANLKFVSNELLIGGGADAGAYPLQVAGTPYIETAGVTATMILNSSTNDYNEIDFKQAGTIRAAIGHGGSGSASPYFQSMYNQIFPGTARWSIINSANAQVAEIDQSGNMTISGTITAAKLTSGFDPAPTGTIVSNLDAIIVYEMQWTRVGDIVEGTVSFDADATATGGFSLEIPPPVASNFTSSTQANGYSNEKAAGGTAALAGYVEANPTTDKLVFTSTSRNAASSVGYSAGFKYRVL